MQDGEKVVYSKYAGTELKLQGKEYVILKVPNSSCSADETPSLL
jgi:co-chaperonin GroES (HSP10)